MTANTFYPSIKTLIGPEDISEALSFVREGVDALLDGIFIKDLQIMSSRADAKAYNVVLHLLGKYRFDILGSGLSIVANPTFDENAVGGGTDIEMSVSYSLPILRYLSAGSLEQFSLQGGPIFDLALNILGLGEEQLLDDVILLFEADSIPRYVDTINSHYSLSGGNAVQNPSGSTHAEKIANLAAALKSNPYILSHYTGVLDVQPIDKSLFVLDVTVAAAGTDPTLKVETVSGGIGARDDSGIISGRTIFHGNASPHRVINEGVQYARLRWTECSPATISIQTYSDYYWGISRRYGWEEMGEFSLSLDRDEVYKRLEDREHFTVHKSWPKYQNDPADTSGRGRVNVCNYRDRWDRNPAPHSNPEYACQDYERDPEDSLAFAVQEYLEKSTIPGNADPYVQRRSKLESFTGDQAEIRLSLLQILNLAAQDYHVARMLGLGYIDWSIPSLPGGSGQRYIYVAEYIVAPRRGRVQAPSGKHLYLTLPTAQTDHRLPVQPSLATGTDPAAIEFGLPAFDADSAPMTDQEGYTTYGGARFIRLNKDALVFDLPASTPFFEGDEEFSRMEHTRPLFYGVTLHRLNGSEYERVWPEISNDAGGYERDAYKPYADASPEHYAETIGIPETTSEDGPFFIHHLVKPQEDPDPLVYQAKLARVEGTFSYGLYGINWFSRASEVNIHPEPVTTQFPKRNTIKPPLNLTAHHIQEERPRVFISAYEAAHLDDFGATTRVTFDWNHIQNAAYRRADLVEFFFRTSSPARVMGQIGRVRELHGTHPVQVQTRSYTDYSVETDPPGGVVIEPAISSEDVSGNLFTGSLLATAGGKFVIVDVIRDSDGHALFTLEMTAEDIGGRRTYVAPKEGERFLVVENLADTGRWKPLPGCSIPLVSFSDHVERHVPAATGREVIDHVGGIYQPATIVAAAVDGAYTITFQNPSGVLLPYQDYPEAAGSTVSEHLERVEWYGGSVRIKDASGAIRTLSVVRIETMPGDPSVPAVPTVLHVAEPPGGGHIVPICALAMPGSIWRRRFCRPGENNRGPHLSPHAQWIPPSAIQPAALRSAIAPC